MNTTTRFAAVSLLTATIMAVANATAAQPVKELQDDFLKLKCGMFIHFNLETYKGVQWVAGYHSPADFNPGSKVDTDAWAVRLPDSGEFYAYHTHAAPSGEDYVGKYSDLIVVLGKGRQLEFARATGYLPVWRTPKGAKSVTDLFPGKDHDPHFYYNYVRLVENGPERIVVHWRYFKDIAALVKANRELDVLNPHGITGVVHEWYVIHPDGRVEREIREASGTRFEDWMDARLASRQSLKLTDAGIEYGPVEPGQKPPFYPRSAVTGSAVKNHADVPRAAHRWTFDEGLKPHEDKVVDAATGTHCAITGLMTHFTRGVSGTALAFDGYYTGVVMETEGRSNEALTVEVWVALDAYPYNTAPLVHQSKGFGKEGWYLGLDAYGHPLVTVAGRTVRAENVVLPLYTWTHVAATLGNGKICLYVDGREAAAGDFAGPVATPPTPILIGRNNEKQRCTDPVRRQRQNLEFVYGIQGLLDEVNVYHAALSPVSVKLAFDALRPSDRASALAKGVLPGDVGPANSFGAAYRTLHFSAVWDRLWRDPPGTEIVVKFDKIPCSVVYWRGTNYAPNWVTENNRWMADQSSEIGGPHGCSEHMADKQVRHCYSRIIENTPARVVVHWRYPCVDVGYVSGGPGNWTDEYHTIYPDGTGVRQVAWNRGGRRPGFQDIQFLTNPGESALDVMNLQAMTIANLKGESRELTWAPPDQVPKNTLPDGCIEVLNSKSQYKVFAIFQGGRINPWGHGEQSRYIPDPFAGPWNHWPMHLVPSDGRFAVANDRVTHFALGANDASPGNVVMYGFTKAPISTLVPLARMWRNPPALTDLRGGVGGGFDKGQKAFLLESTGARMSFTVAASDESPLVHPCFVIRKFGRGEATVAINGKLAAGVRQGAIVDTDGTPATVIWIERQWASPATFVVEAGADRRPAFKTAAKDGGKPPILVVPAVKESLHFAMDLPPTVDDQAAWQFVEVGKDRPLVAQVVPRIAADGTIAAGGRIVADLSPADAAGGKPRCFRLQRADEHVTWPSAHKFTDDNATSLRLSEGEKPVLVYNYGTITNEKVPKKDSRRSRACYIHPLWGLNGEVLTDDFPRDHYHHHGVFWAWPHVEIGGEKHDLWMYKDITHKTIARLAAQTGPLAAVLGMENGWFVGGRKVMTERVWIEVARPTADWRTVDLDFTWIPVDRPITLRGAEGKSYGGLTVRFAVKNGKQAIITVPGGRAAADLPDTPLPWADLSYPFANADSRSANGTAGLSGAAIFVPRDHPDYPPTWLTRHYGPLCIGWPGVKGKTFGPGKPIRLRYRLWIHKAAADTAALKAAYEAYLAGNSAHWESPNERNDTP